MTIILIKVFIKWKLSSVETSLGGCMHTNTHTGTTHMSILTIQSLLYTQLKIGSAQRLEMDVFSSQLHSCCLHWHHHTLCILPSQSHVIHYAILFLPSHFCHYVLWVGPPFSGGIGAEEVLFIISLITLSIFSSLCRLLLHHRKSEDSSRFTSHSQEDVGQNSARSHGILWYNPYRPYSESLFPGHRHHRHGAAHDLPHGPWLGLHRVEHTDRHQLQHTILSGGHTSTVCPVPPCAGETAGVCYS